MHFSSVKIFQDELMLLWPPAFCLSHTLIVVMGIFSIR